MQVNIRTTLNDIVDEYRRTGQVIRWPVPQELQSSAAVEYRNDFAQTLAKSLKLLVRMSTCQHPVWIECWL